MRSWKQRLWSLLLCGAMLLTLLPPPALAEEPEDGISYVDGNGVWQTIPINRVEMLDSNNTGNLELTVGQFYFVKEHETQLAVMLWRYVDSPAATSKELYFSDEGEIGGYALDAIRWAVENGILNGYGDGRLGPQGQATRAQVAQMLKNFIENQEVNT